MTGGSSLSPSILRTLRRIAWIIYPDDRRKRRLQIQFFRINEGRNARIPYASAHYLMNLRATGRSRILIGTLGQSQNALQSFARQNK